VIVYQIPEGNTVETGVAQVLSGLPPQFRTFAVIQLLFSDAGLRQEFARNFGERVAAAQTSGELEAAVDRGHVFDDLLLGMLEELLSKERGAYPS
jgi:hypothetical protein